MPPRPDGGGGETSGRASCTDILVSKHWSTKELFPSRMNATSSAAADPVVIPRHVKRIAIVVILGAIMSVLDTTIVNVALRHSRARPAQPAGPRSSGWSPATCSPSPPSSRSPAGPPAASARAASTCLARRCSPSGSRAVRPRLVHRLAHRLPRPAGHRRRPAHADRPDDPRQGRRPAQPRPRVMSIDRRPDHPRARSSGRRSAACCSSTPAGSGSSSSTSRSASSPLSLALRLLPADEPEERRPARRARPRRSSPPASSASPTAWPRPAPPAPDRPRTCSSRCSAASRSSRRSSCARCASTQPLLDVRLYANRAFAAASLTTFCLGAALFGAMILMPLYFQTVRGEDAVHTGLLLDAAGHRRRVRDGALRPRDRALRRRPHRAGRRHGHARRHAAVRAHRRRDAPTGSSAPR